jgi:outer membrane immunogenic protein
MDATTTTIVRAFVAAAASTIFGPVLAADIPVGRSLSTPEFIWTSCHLGAHAGGGWARTSITDPAGLVQGAIIGPGTTLGVTTVSPNPSGAVIGGQAGCDYQFMSNWVIGIEGAATGSTMKGNTMVTLPAGNPGDQAGLGAHVDFLSSVTGRFGLAFDRLLFYGKGGVAWAGDKYTVVGTLLGGPFGFEGLDLRTGWTVGGGVEWAFVRSWSVSLEYDQYSFGRGTILMSDRVNGFSGSLDVKQSIHLLKASLNFHMWSSR